MEALTVELPDGVGGRSSSLRRRVSSVRKEDWPESQRDHYAPCPSPPALPSSSSSSPWSRSVLSKMLRVQSLGDVDFGRLYDAYDSLVDRLMDGSFSYDQMRWTHPRMTAEWLLSSSSTADETADASILQDVRMVQRYRISSTARDCSVMIAFQRLSPEELAAPGCGADEQEELLLELNDEVTFRCRISVVDLDPKPVSCVDKHRRRNQAMTEAFQLSVAAALPSPSPVASGRDQ